MKTPSNTLDPIAAQLAALGVDTRGGPDACWVYGRLLHPSQYVRFWVDGRAWTGHRFVWVLAHGEVPPRRHVYNVCGGGPRCLRPEHMSLRPPRRRPPRVPSRPARKLTTSRVRSIRRAVARGAKMSALARRFGLHVATISRAARRVTWAAA